MLANNALKAWAAARTSAASIALDLTDELIRWAKGDPRFIEKQENGMAHVQWTIQLRFDPLGDEEKKEYVTAAVIRAASHILATANLIEGPIQSTIAVYSDDFMKARKQIELVPDVLGAALKEYGGSEQEGLSAEMQEVVSGLNNKGKRR